MQTLLSYSRKVVEFFNIFLGKEVSEMKTQCKTLMIRGDNQASAARGTIGRGKGQRENERNLRCYLCNSCSYPGTQF